MDRPNQHEIKISCDQPKIDCQYDVEVDEEYQKTKKRQQLDALEAFHKVPFIKIAINLKPRPCSLGRMGVRVLRHCHSTRTPTGVA